MIDQDQTRDWRELCKAAANEQDPKKLMALIAEISKALDDRDRRRNANCGNEDNREADLSMLSGAA